jgi:small-conductance mechanosensitive channel
MELQPLQVFYPLQEVVDTPAEAYREILLPLGKFAVTFLLVYIVGKVLVGRAVVRVVRQRNPNNRKIQNAVRRYFQLVVLLVALAFGVVAAGYGHVLSRSALVFAAATLAVGVAGQEVIGALISGLFLVANPNFNVGDWIAWSEREGVVEAISFRTTRVRTENNETLTVPNTELTANSIVRPYGREQYRVAMQVGIDYDDDVDAAMDSLRAAAESQPEILGDPEPRVYFEEFGDDELLLEVQYWVRDPTRRDVKRVRSEFGLDVKSRFEGTGLTISPASARELSGNLSVDGSVGDENARRSGRDETDDQSTGDGDER